MTIIAGFSASGHGPAPLHLAAQLSRCTGDRIIAAVIVERPWPRKPDPYENEYLNYLGEQAQKSVKQLVDQLPDDLDIWPLVHQAPSVPVGLSELAAEMSADIVVVGSSSSGLLGRIALGSVTDRLVHTAAVPVAIAPR
ncbi:universal stress protein, partial [Mycobacterium sp. ITM-2017-0098]